MTVDNCKLRELGASEVASYLRQLMEDQPEESISAHILAAVERQSVPPTVFSVWLSVARTSATLLKALTQEFSVYTRQSAIKHLCKLLRRNRWREIWKDVGGIPGLFFLLKSFSVSDVRLFFRLLPWTANGPDKAEKQDNITELLKGLLPMFYPDAQFKASEERPLLRYYQLLLPGCNTKFVDKVLRDGKDPLLSDGKYDNQTSFQLLRQHYEILRQHCLDKIFGFAHTSVNIQFYLSSLLRSTPGLPTSVPGISESMAFSLLLLQRLVSQPDAKIPVNVLTELIEPLLWRARKKKADPNIIAEIVDLSITYLSCHVNEAKRLSFSQNKFLYMCIKMWASPFAERLGTESRLVSVLGLVSSDRSHHMKVYGDCLHWVRKPLRYKLLKLFLLHIGDKKVDIDQEESLKNASLKKWPCSIFFAIKQDKAVGLLRRLRTTSLQDDFLERSYANSIFSHPPSQDISSANSSILLNVLEMNENKLIVQERAASVIKDQKKKSVNSREQVERSFYAKSALFFAISSGSLELYRETLNWANRFVRDPLTVKVIFAKSANNTSQGISLLSAIPESLEGLGPPEITSRIKFSNQVMFDVFETACSSLKEPSFYRPDWSGPLELFGEVVYERLTVASRVQAALRLSDDQLYEVLWDDTLKLLLRIEKIGLQAEYERLQLRDPCGLLKPRYAGYKQNLIPTSLRFIDNLARERDYIWQEFRVTINSAVAALPPPLPRGLPVQCLAPGLDVGVRSAFSFTPFIISRAEALVFMEPDEALMPVPEDEETRSAIGSFVDSFTYALQIYVKQGESSAIKYSRTTRAWEHALKNLSGRMSPAEAYRTWKRYFIQALPKFEMPDIDPKMIMAYPHFPFGAEVGEYTEWNPVEAFNPPPTEKSRRLGTLRYLDCTLGTHLSSRPGLGADFVEKCLQTVGFEPPGGDIWSLHRLSGEHFKVPALREGLIVSALLFLEQHIPDHKSVLTTPFPSLADVRYPDLWLDLSFAELKGIGMVTDNKAFQILEDLSSTVPPSLLHKLTEAALDPLFKVPAKSDSKIIRLEGVAYRFLSLLAESDRPFLGTHFILKIIIDRPDSSSWHRQLLSVPFLRSLSVTQAKVLIQSFADAIKQKTKETAEFISKEIAKPVPDSQRKVDKPYVKITTIKYLAQLLQDADFLPARFAVDILSGLLTTSTHVDVRAAIVGSLMEMLARCQDDASEPLGDRILQVLESIISIGGRLDERYGPQDHDWDEAKRIGKLPAIYEQGSTPFDCCIPPILGAIIYQPLLDRWEEKVLKQIVLPILETSTTTNTRWLESFTAKHGLDFLSLTLPLLPVKAKFLKEVLKVGYQYLPASLMELYGNFILTNISPPPQVAKLNKRLKDPTLSHFPEVKHWLSLYGHGPNINSYDRFNLIDLLRQDWPHPNSSITILQIQDHVFEHAKLLLITNQPSAFESFIKSFGPYSRSPRTIDSPDWLKNAKPVLHRIISIIESMRTPAWQRNPERQPKILPQTLRYRLWLLPYPGADAGEKEVLAFADAVRGFVIDISKPAGLYHEQLPEILDAVKELLVVHRPKVAYILGFLKDKLDLVDLLCVEISKALFATVTQPTDESVTAEGRKVVMSWVGCENECVRRKGMELFKMRGLFGIEDEFGLHG